MPPSTAKLAPLPHILLSLTPWKTRLSRSFDSFVADWASSVVLVSFLGTPELLATYKAFIRSSMEYCSPLWAGVPASHLARLHAVETKAFRIIGISCDEADCEGLSLSPQAGWWSFCLLPTLLWPCPPSSLCALSPKYSYRSHTICQQPSYG